MIIRDMTPDDILDCRAIVTHHWGHMIGLQAQYEMEEMFKSNSKWPPHYIVAEDDFGVAGFAGFKSAWLMSNAFELIWINVRQNQIGNGIGKLLTEKRLQMIAERHGTMVMLMSQKPDFFTQFGFKTVENLNGWCLMTRQLAPVTIDFDRSI